MIPEWGGGGNFAIDRVRARIKTRMERAENGPWRRCITAPRTKEKQVSNPVIPASAIEAAKEAMREVTPPPGVSKADWLAEHGDFALIAGAIAAAAPYLRQISASDIAAVADMIKAAKANGWDEGFSAGEDVGNWYAAPVTKQPIHTNPYRS